MEKKKKFPSAYQTGLSPSLKFKTNKVMPSSAYKTGKLSEARLSAYWMVTEEVSGGKYVILYKWRLLSLRLFGNG